MTQKTRKKFTGTRYYDYTLVFLVIFLCCFGLVMVFSTSYYTASISYGDTMYYVKRQGMFMLLGIVVMFIVSKLIDYHRLKKIAIPAWVLAFILMVMTNYIPGFGKEVNGQKRWFQISGHAIFQPSEAVKITIIICMAALLVKLAKNLDTPRGIILCGIIVLPLDFLVLSNNLSTGIIILGIAFVMIFIASRRKKIFAILVAAGVALMALFVMFSDKLVSLGIIKDYQLQRILAWQHPEDYSLTTSLQTLQGLYAIGSGGLFGKGLGNSIQKLGFVPEAQNDMIFSIICEELGLFGALAVILLFLFLIYRLFVIARNAPDMFGSMLVVGIMSHISLQVILNIAVVTNTIPNTGVTLPFFSYGGTAVVFLLFEMGVALGVSNRIVIDERSGERVDAANALKPKQSVRRSEKAKQARTALNAKKAETAGNGPDETKKRREQKTDCT